VTDGDWPLLPDHGINAAQPVSRRNCYRCREFLVDMRAFGHPSLIDLPSHLKVGCRHIDEGPLLAALGRRATRGEGRVGSTGDVTDPFPQTRSRDVFGDDRDPACEQRDAKCSSLSIVASV